ncbi:hypothetical protein ACN27G_09905 [Plantactinospora sp. WMMB334]|uniref:hypothetical protein n=1 Tax=Plantactinospora sp. WMMB334 TaxID=3404119 RepID=UPI003B950DE4
MPGLRELLERFRPAGTPGAATAAGVPADRRAAVAAELRPVFAALAATERECDELREAAAATAGQRRADSTGRARAILDAARTDAPVQRAAAAARRRDADADDLDRLVAAARSAAREERRRAGEQLPGQVTAVLALVRADLGRMTGGDPP